MSPPRLRLGTLSLVLAMLCVVAAPLALGAVHAQVVVALAVIAHLALVLHVTDRVLRGRSLAVSWLGLPIALGLVFTWFEVTPLPEALREVLAPASTERVRFVTGLLPEEMRGLVRPVLSLDPPETALAALRLAAALCVFVVVADRCRRRETRRLAYRMVLGGAAATVLVGVGHRLLSEPLIYGRFEPFSGGFIHAPLVNPNHLARAFGALSLLCVGQSFLVRSRVERAMHLVVGSAAGVCGLLSYSTGGTLAYIAALGLLLFLALRRVDGEESHGLEPPRTWQVARLSLRALGLAMLAALVIAGVKIAELALPADPEARFARGKLELYGPTVDLILALWRSGTGNGAFQSGLPATLEVGELWEYATVSHVENVVLQTFASHGIVPGLLVLGAALLVATALFRGAVQRAAVPGVATLFFLVAGDLVDFSLELGFGVLLASYALASCAATFSSSGAPSFRVPRRAGVAVVGALSLIALASSVVSLSDVRFDTDRALQTAVGEERRAILLRAMALHPSDPHYAFGLAVDARHRRDAREALRWVNRALALWPGHPQAHVEAARALAALGHLEQALLEYRLAWASGAPARGQLLQEIARRTPDVGLRRLALPDDDAAALEALCRLLDGEKRPDEAERCWEEAATMAEASERARARWVGLALARGDGEEAERRIAVLSSSATPWEGGALEELKLRALALTKGMDEALRAAAAVSSELKDPIPVLRWRLEAALTFGRHDDARDAIAQLRRLQHEPRDVHWIDRQEARLLEESHDYANALVLWRRISSRSPRDPAPALRAARLELQLGFVDAAALSVARARAIAPNRADVKRMEEQVLRAKDQAREERVRELWQRAAPEAP